MTARTSAFACGHAMSMASNQHSRTTRTCAQLTSSMLVMVHMIWAEGVHGPCENMRHTATQQPAAPPTCGCMPSDAIPATQPASKCMMQCKRVHACNLGRMLASHPFPPPVEFAAANIACSWLVRCVLPCAASLGDLHHAAIKLCRVQPTGAVTSMPYTSTMRQSLSGQAVAKQRAQQRRAHSSNLAPT